MPSTRPRWSRGCGKRRACWWCPGNTSGWTATCGWALGERGRTHLMDGLERVRALLDRLPRACRRDDGGAPRLPPAPCRARIRCAVTSMGPPDPASPSRLHPRALRPVLHDDPRRPRRAGHQGRTSRPRRRHAALGAAVPRRRERLLPERQPQQGERRGRLQDAGRPRAGRRLLAARRRRGRELPPGHARRRRPRRGHVCARRIRESSTAPSRASARPARGATSPATTR